MLQNVHGHVHMVYTSCCFTVLTPLVVKLGALPQCKTRVSECPAVDAIVHGHYQSSCQNYAHSHSMQTVPV